MKRKLLSLALVFVMLAAVIPLSVGAAGEIIVQETFETLSTLTSGMDFGGENATLTLVRVPTIVTGTGGGQTDKSMKLTERNHTITLKEAPTEDYVIEFDLYGEGTFAPSSGTELRLMQMTDITRRPISINTSTNKFQTNAADLDLDYVSGHWYHAKVEFTMSNADTPLETRWTTTIEDLATGKSVSKSVLISGTTKPNSTIVFLATYADANTSALYMDNVEIYTGTAGGALHRAALIPNAASFQVSGVSADENGGTVSVTGGANAAENYLKTGGTATATATAKTGYTFAGWTADGMTLTDEQKTANPLEITVEDADVTLTAAFSPNVDTSITPTTANYDKYAAHENHRDIVVTLNAGGSSAFTALKYGDTALTAGTDYTVAGNVYTIKTTYLDTLPVGDATLTFDMDGGTDPALAIAVADSTPSVEPHTVTAGSANAAQGSAAVKTAGETFAQGTSVTVEATANNGYKFSGWTAEGITLTAEQQTQNPLTFTMPDNDVMLTAAFEEDIEETNVTIEQNTMDSWAALEAGTTPTEFVYNSANGAYGWQSSTLQVDMADDGNTQNASLLLQSTKQPNYLSLTPGETLSDWTFAYDFLGTFAVSDFSSITRLQLMYLSSTRAFTVETSGSFAVNGVNLTDSTGAAMTYQPNHWYHVELYMPASGMATVTLTDTTANQTASYSYSPNNAARAFGNVWIQTCRNIALYLDNIDLYTGAPDRTRLATPTLLPGTTPPEEGTYKVTAGSANAAQGAAAVKTAGETFAQGTSVTVEATANNGYKFSGWTAEGITLTAEQQTQNPLTFTMPANAVTVTAAFVEKTNAAVTPNAATYDKYSGSDNHAVVAVTLNAGDYTLSALKVNGAALTAGTDYTVSGNLYTLSMNYLDTLAVGSYTLTFDMDGGTDPTVAITVANSTPDIKTYKVTAAADNSAQGSAAVTTPGETFEAGVTVTVTATAAKGYLFAGWTAEGITLTAEQQTQNPLTFTMPAADVTLRAVFQVDETPDAIEQNTFENWTLPAAGTTQDFVVSQNGSYAWKSGTTKMDTAYRWSETNTSLLLDGTSTDAYLNINFTDALNYSNGYTIAYDFIGTDENYEISTATRFMVLIQYPTISRRPFEIGSDGIFEYNGVDMNMRYTPNHWYHVQMQVGVAGASGASTTITLTDLMTGESTSNSFMLNNNPQTEKQIRINATEGFGKLYIDNLDIYEGAPDTTRLATPTMLPATESGQQPGADYYIDASNTAEGITITKNVASEDDRVVIVTALYDTSTGAPSLAAVKSKEATLQTGETVSLSAEEIVHKPAEGSYSIRYFIWKIGDGGETLEALVAIDVA